MSVVHETSFIGQARVPTTARAMYQRNNPKQPLLPHSAPSRPWERVGADLCELSGKHYLILVDYYSNFIEVDQLRETTSGQVIERCESDIADMSNGPTELRRSKRTTSRPITYLPTQRGLIPGQVYKNPWISV